jgi:hypothetical protein
MPRISLVIACVTFIVGCGSTPTSPSDVPLSQLSSAPTRIVADGQTLTLTTFLYRDFMPISPPDGKPLGGTLRIQTDDGSPVSAGVTAETSWVINKGEVWSTTVEQWPRADTAPNYEVIVRGGPKWGPNVTVDVVARVRDSKGTMFLLRAPEQSITGAY